MTDNPLQTPYRVIRRVAPPDVPVPGVLVAAGDTTALLVDLDRMPSAVWAHDAAEHIWAPVDIVRTETGQAALLPWCSQTLSTLLAKRRSEPLSGGECVTIAVSMLRGLRELGNDDEVTGTWWLTEDGCPMFVHGAGGVINTVSHGSANLLVDACSDSVVRKTLLAGLAVFRVPLPSTEAAQLEERLFAAAAPQAVRVSMLAPVPASDVASIRRPVAAEFKTPGVLELVRNRITSAVDAWRERAEDKLARRRRREPQSGAARNRVSDDRPSFEPASRSSEGRTRGPEQTTRKTRPMLVAGAVGAVVITVGMLWPQPPPSSSASEPAGGATVEVETSPQDGVEIESSGTAALPKTQPPKTPAPTSGADDAPVDAPQPEDVTAAAAVLQTQAAACLAAGSMCETVATDIAVAEAFVAVTDLVLIEDYGGVAIFRGTAADGDKYVVFEKAGGVWRVREVNVAPAAPSG